jgi:hypothetical protein
MRHPPAQFTYFLSVCVLLVLVATFGQAFQKPGKRVGHILIGLLVALGAGLYWLKSKPLLKTFAPRYVRPDDEARGLFNIAFWNTVSLVLFGLAALVSVGVEESDDDENVTVVKSPTKKKAPSKSE